MVIELGPFSGLPLSPNQTTGLHWSKTYKSKSQWQQMVQLAAKQYMVTNKLKGLMEHAKVHYHISVGDNRQHDPDNLAWSVTKPTLDGLKGIIIVDDNIDVVELSYTFDRQKPRGFTITLEEVV